MKYVLALVASFFSIALYANDNYDTRLIPDSLTKNSNVVTRIDEMVLEVLSTKEAILRTKLVVTILNEKGDKYSSLHESYDKFKKVLSIDGALYDATGKQIKKLRKQDIVDMLVGDDISLIADNRAKLFSFNHKIYPYTVEYEVETKLLQTFYLPGSFVIGGYNQSVEQFKYTLIYPEDLAVRYKAIRFPNPPITGTPGKGKKILTWEMRNVKAIEPEMFMPHPGEIFPRIAVAATNFEIDGYKGNMTNWNELGKFLYELKKNRDELPEEMKQKAIQLVAGVTDEREKVKRIFQYLQQNTRYISIQLGIGGFQPFDASYVASKGYGDCKALSNYMYSLLKVVGVDSKYVIIYAGNNFHMNEDFPSNQFNHATLCVPMKSQKDTIWLECTSQTVAPGYQGSFTGNRKALLCDENGGSLINTKHYGLNENLQERKLKATVQEDGNMQAVIRTNYRALKQDNLHGLINAYSKEKIKEYLNHSLGLPSFNVNSFNYTEQKSELPVISEDLDLSLNNYATISGKRIFITPNLISKSWYKSSEKERHFDIAIDDEFREIDSAEIEVPAGYEPEALPSPVSLKTKYGTYTSSVKFENNKIIYYRKVEQIAGNYPRSEYKDFAAFLDAKYKADRTRVVLVKK